MKMPRFTTRDMWEIDKLIAQKSLYQFLRQAWPHFDPSAFVDAWHIGAIAEHLEAVNAGEIKRLLVNIPPRHCKTNLVAVAWPVWTWIQDAAADYPLRGPGVRFLCASYGANKAQGDGVTARRLIASVWFQQRWGVRVQIVKDRDNQEQYDNTAGGSRISTGIPESLGKGGAIRIVDDPHKTDEVESKNVIASQIKAYDEVWRTRSNDPKYGAEVIIMQRLGEDDLSGHLINGEEDFVHLCLPLRYDEGRRCVTVLGIEDRRKRDGELLWPERFDETWARSQEEFVGPYAWANQYQQLPVPRGGGIIRREAWRMYGPDDPIAMKLKFPPFSYVVASLDTAFTGKEENDPSALVILGVWAHPDTGFQQVMLVYAWRDRLTLHELVRRVAHTCDKYRVDGLLIENKASGLDVQSEMMRMYQRTDWSVVMTDPTRAGSKEARAHSVTHLFDEGMVHRPNTEWGLMVEDECAVFPRGRHDDLVDATVAGLRYLRDAGILSRKQEQRERERDLAAYRGKSSTRALYAA
jgi:predicted phage terminase large subunit-like protein